MTARTDWTRHEIAALFDLPFGGLVYQAQTVHRAHHAAGQIQLCTATRTTQEAEPMRACEPAEAMA